jgi:mannan polymerase II complex MNN11 subunit
MQLTYNNKFKPQKNALMGRLHRNYKKLSVIVVFLVVAILLILNTSLTSGVRSLSQSYTKLHSYHKNDILTKNALIFPSIEHAPLLRELTVDSLFNAKVDPQGKRRYLIAEALDAAEEKLNAKYEADDTTSEMIKVKKSFADHGKQKFNGPHSPEVVLVTTIDFEKYELSALTKIVQNRVNYAQKKKYGVYIRWTQEFLPMLSEYGADKDWAKLYALRSAMYAFPKAKYFWYLDQDALIMRYDIDLIKYLLDPRALDPIMLREQPIVPPNGVIRTFKNTEAAHVDLIVTQNMDLNSFVIKNTLTSRALLDFWNDPLFKSYNNFPRLSESALIHILQWHPRFLSHTALVPPRTIGSLHTAMKLIEGDDIHYSNGDFVVNFKDCAQRKSCEKEIESYWEVLQTK